VIQVKIRVSEIVRLSIVPRVYTDEETGRALNDRRSAGIFSDN